MSDLYRDLGWLPQPPADFRTRCAEADLAGLRRLAATALGIDQLTRLGRRVDALRRAGADRSMLVPLRLALVGSATTSFLVPALIGSALRHGILVEAIETPFGEGVQQALDPASPLVAAAPDAVLIALDAATLGLAAFIDDDTAASSAVADALGLISSVRAAVRAAGAVAVVANLAPAPERLFGGLDRAVAGSPRRLADAFNEVLAAALAGSGDLLLDVAGLAETVGLAAWHDPVQWALAKLPFAQDLVPLWADHVGRLLGALKGKSRRCLVLDLDGTLWHGVIGDDGLEGIVVGQGSPLGEAHLALQRLALELRRRGVVLAVASKNDDATARLPFERHPDMLLRLEHLAVLQANWTDKAANLVATAEALSLGRDALVFVDDNPAERELIRQRLPEVAVPELPADPALFARTLAAAGYFEAIAFSAEDRARAGDYAATARRLELQRGSGSLDDYLRSLGMRLTIGGFDPVSRPRVAQLIAKSNQFNLTTRRYAEAEIARLAEDPAVFTLQARLADRFGDSGLIAVVICRPDDAASGVWEIDTWLMSCRVLKRRVEETILAELLRAARAAGIGELRGRYVPTPRNGMVAGHYASLGFRRIGGEEGGETVWSLPADAPGPRDLPFEIVRAAAAPDDATGPARRRA